MAEEKLMQLADTIRCLVAEVRTSTDPEKRTQCLQDALTRACEMIMCLNESLEWVDRILKGSGFGEEHAAIPFRDVVNGIDELAHFQSKEALLKFLAACAPLLVSQGLSPKKEIQEMLSHVRDTYEQFMDKKVGLDQMCEQFDRLERFFCRPPYDGCDGSQLIDRGGPDGGVSVARGETVCCYLATFAAIGSLIVSVITLFACATTGPTAKLHTPEERTVSLLSLLLLSDFSHMLDKREDIPTKLYVPKKVMVAGK